MSGSLDFLDRGGLAAMAGLRGYRYKCLWELHKLRHTLPHNQENKMTELFGWLKIYFVSWALNFVLFRCAYYSWLTPLDAMVVHATVNVSMYLLCWLWRAASNYNNSTQLIFKRREKEEKRKRWSWSWPPDRYYTTCCACVDFVFM